MPSPYKHKTDRQSWSEEAMARALETLRSGSCDYFKGAKQFDIKISKSIMESRFKKKNKQAVDH